MKRRTFIVSCAAVLIGVWGLACQAAEGQQGGKLRILVFGAHPDDCEIRCGGVASLWSARGDLVKFVSTTNGDIGHWGMAGGPLAIRRTNEVQAGRRVRRHNHRSVDIHDGEILADTRKSQDVHPADSRVGGRHQSGTAPNDYHPDHRYTGVLMQDSAYMVTVPFFCPDIPPLKKNPVFLYSADGFQRPNPFQADIGVSIDSVIEKKVDALVLIESQFVEGGANGSAESSPKTLEEREAKRAQVRESFKRRFAATANQWREKLVELYGQDAGGKVQYAEAFEICEYGRRPSKEEILRLFPIQQ